MWHCQQPQHYLYLYNEGVTTLLGNIIAGFFMTGKIFDREKYGGIFQNPPLYPGYNIPE